MPKYSTPQEAFAGEYTKADLDKIVGLTRGEADLWPKRGIISGHDDAPGSGRHRTYSFWNLVEARIAKSLSTGFKMQTGQIEVILQGVRCRLNERGIGTTGFPWESLFMGDWTFSVIPSESDPKIHMHYGGLGEDNFYPVVTTMSIGMVANELLDIILEDEDAGCKGSQNWYGNAFYARQAKTMGTGNSRLPMASNTLTRKKPASNENKMISHRE